ncbi:glycosyltransferase family 2 protein, partial [Aureobasidium melanogenum]
MQAGLLIMSSPLASGFYALSSNHQRKGSEDIGPEEVIHSDANHGLPNHGSLPVSQHIESPKPSRQPEEDQSTHSGPEDAASSTNEIVKPSPAYKAYTAADRKSTNASLQDSTTASPFLIPLYDRPSLTKRISTNIGPYDFGTTSSPFSRLSYGSSMFNRRSRILAPDGNPAAQQVFPARKASDEEDPANIGLDERTPNRTTAIRRSLGPGDWDSSSVSPGAADPTASDEVRKSIPNDYAAGGAINTAKPFFASTNPFAKKPDTSKATSGTEQLPTRTASMSYGKRTSRNFSKKLPNITVPENKTSISGPTPTLPSAAMADTSMQTPTRASFASVHEQKRPRLSSAAFTGLTPLSEKEVQFDQSTFGNSTPVSSRQPSTIGTSRRTSMIGPPSAMDNRRPSLAGSRRSSISVTNVVIPAHLMTHVETNWNEDNVIGRRKSTYRREDSRSSFNIQSMAQQQQEEVKNIIKMTPQAPDHMSTSMEALAQADPFAAMRERQTSARMSRGKSLAAVSEAIDPNEEESEKPLTPNEPPEGLTPWGQFAFRYRDADVSPGAAIDPADPMAAVGAALGLVATNNTNNSNPTARRPSMWRRIATADVNGPYNGERRGTVFQRANSVFQDTLLNVRKKVRRSSMWDVYENAKKRQLAIRRKRWVQITFEYSFYAMLLVLLYFLIIGVPLWKGTYWELYLAFKYKLNVTGSWSVIIAVS